MSTKALRKESLKIFNTMFTSWGINHTHNSGAATNHTSETNYLIWNLFYDIHWIYHLEWNKKHKKDKPKPSLLKNLYIQKDNISNILPSTVITTTLYPQYITHYHLCYVPSIFFSFFLSFLFLLSTFFRNNIVSLFAY